MSPLPQRARGGLILAAAAVAAFVGGVAVGSGPTPDEPSSSVLDEAADRIVADAARPVERDVLERAAVDGMLKALGDRWSAYFEPSDLASFSDALEGRYSGVGLWLRQDPDGRLLVSGVQQGSPAERGGVRVGDEVVSVAGAAVVGEPVSAVLARLRGDVGTRVEVGLRRADGTVTVGLDRESVATDDVVVDRLRHHVLRIRVAVFTRGAGRQVRAALDEAGEAADGGVVLDLRGNPGGLVDEAVEVAGAFLDGGPVVSYQRRGEALTTVESHQRGDLTTPLVVLVDGGSASAAEIVAGALQDRNRAVVVGSRTFGKGSVQEPQELSDGSALELTVGAYLTPSGRALDGVGIEPDVVVDAEEAPEVAERRALEVLTGLLAALGPGGRG